MRKSHVQQGAILSLYAMVAVAFLGLIIISMSGTLNKSTRISGELYAEKQAYWNAVAGIELALHFVDLSNSIQFSSPHWEKENFEISKTDIVRDLIADYHFDGNFDDMSLGGSDNTALHFGSIRLIAGRFSAPLGNYSACHFDGVDDYLTANSVSVDIATSPFTLTAWINPQENIDNVVLFLFRRSDGSDTFLFSVHNNFFSYYDGSHHDGSITVNDNLWHHIGVVYNGSSIITYVDGFEDQPLNSTSYFVGAQDLFSIGGESISVGEDYEYYQGLIEEVRVYAVALTPSEIRDLATPYVSVGQFLNTVKTNNK